MRRHPVRQQQGVAVLRSRRAVRCRHFHRHLSDQLAGAGRVSGQRLQGQVPVRRERGAARQDPGRARAHAAPEEDHRVRHGRPARVCRPAGDAAQRAQRTRRSLCPRPRAGMGAAHRHPEIRRCRDHRLYLGHHGAVEGRAADASQHHLPGRRLQAHRSRDLRDRRGAQFPAPVPRRRAVRRLLQSHRLDARRQFRRGARYGAAEPARGVAAHLPRRAARVGEALLRSSPSL